MMTDQRSDDDDGPSSPAAASTAVRRLSPLEVAGGDDLGNGDETSHGEERDAPSSIEERYRAERERAKLRHWKESEYAAGRVAPTWSDELESYRRGSGCCGGCCGEDGCGGGGASQALQSEIDPGCGCTYLSALVCSRLGAGRIGNMAVLRERYVTVEVEDDGDDVHGEGGREEADGFVDEEEPASLRLRDNGGGSPSKPRDGDRDNSGAGRTKKTRMVRKREIQFVVGPFWPMLLLVTYPLIFGVSLLTLWSGLPGKPLYVQAGWAVLTGTLIVSLFNTGFRDPGILQRRTSPPPAEDDGSGDDDGPRRRVGFRWGNEAGPWRWSDQAHSYRPRNSMYCPDCKVVIEEFDHTCPWTGTAIGKKNMGAFQVFVGLVFVCLIVDIFLLTAGSM